MTCCCVRRSGAYLLEDEPLSDLSRWGAVWLRSQLVSIPRSSSVLGVNSLLCLELAAWVLVYSVSDRPCIMVITIMVASCMVIIIMVTNDINATHLQDLTALSVILQHSFCKLHQLGDLLNVSLQNIKHS